MKQSSSNQKSLHKLLHANSTLFWWVPPDKLENIPLESLVAAVLNYGTLDGVKSLIEEFGIDTVATIFRKQLQYKRKVYLPQVANYFSLYFAKHAH